VIWRVVRQTWAEFRQLSAAYGRALQAPQLFAVFFDMVVADSMTVPRKPRRGLVGSGEVVALLEVVDQSWAGWLPSE
jgi:hypothetical protein